MFMLMFYFAMLPFMENCNGFKQLQPTSTAAYWFDVLIIDSLLFLGICFVLFGYQALIMPHELYEISDLINIVSALFFYGLSYLPLVYTFANLFTALSTLSSCMSALFFVSCKSRYLFFKCSFFNFFSCVFSHSNDCVINFRRRYDKIF